VSGPLRQYRGADTQARSKDHLTITSQVSKVLEGFTLKSLLLQVAVKIDSMRFSFQSKSAIHALVYLLHSILAALESGQCSVLVILRRL
jgi:hypothetical protein